MTITHGGPAGRHATLPSQALPNQALPHQALPYQAPSLQAPPIQRPARKAAPARPAPAGQPSGHPRVRVGRQVAILAAAVTAYFLVRGATESAYAEALRNAYLLVDLERQLGFWWEPALQDSLTASPGVRAALNAIYIYGHWPVIVISLVWLARRHPAIYFRTRNAMLLSGAIGLVVFVSFPVAPPRLAGLGMTDTVSLASEAYRVLQPTIFTNQYAAMPSLHVGWDLLIGLGLFAASRRPLARILALSMPAAMLVAVILTANHYIVDAVVGAALVSACWLAANRSRRRTLPQWTVSTLGLQSRVDAGGN